MNMVVTKTKIAGAETINFGQEKSPIVIIDNFTGAVELLIEAGLKANYKEAPAAYPGLRATANPNYLKLRDAMMLEIFNNIFGLHRMARSMHNQIVSFCTGDKLCIPAGYPILSPCPPTQLKAA